MTRVAALVLLGAAGVLLGGAPLAARTARRATGYSCAGQIQKLFDNSNGFAVSNGGTRPSFTTTGPFCVTSIQTYHWNGGQGATAVSLSLVHQSGPAGFDTVGPFAATGSAGQNNAPNVNWRASFNANANPVVIDGTYQCGDSDTATWSTNATAGNAGFCIVYGIPAQLVETTPTTTGAATTTTHTEPPDAADLAVTVALRPKLVRVTSNKVTFFATITAENNGPDAAFGVHLDVDVAYAHHTYLGKSACEKDECLLHSMAPHARRIVELELDLSAATALKLYTDFTEHRPTVLGVVSSAGPDDPHPENNRDLVHAKLIR